MALLGLVVAGTAATTLPAWAQANFYHTSRFYPEEAILDWSGEHFTIIRIDTLEMYSDERVRLESWMRAYPDRIAELQDTIRQNKEFAAALRARSVQLRNVVAIQRALNGNLIVYLR